MRLGTTRKQPRERKSVSVVYQRSLDEGDSLQTIEWATVDPVSESDPLTAQPVLVSEDRIRLWLDGGVDQTTYKVTVLVTTSGGERLEDELLVQVRED